MEFMELAKNRYSCRAFTAQAVEPEKLAKVLEAGRLSPTAINAQPVTVKVIKSDASIVTTSMMMQATDLGLATLWARGFNAAYIETAFGFPENLKLACLLDIGYADPENGGPSPRHPVRKSMEEFASEV